MTKTKSTKRALLMSALSLLMCVSMLIGSTFAWFTDSVTSSGNIIKSGTLDVGMYWANGTEDPASVTWTDASTGAIFNYDKWEPGYVEVRHIKIANEGTLALKYQLNILANSEVSDLADVIDVYYLDPAEQVSDRTALTADKKLGTLTQVLANISTTASGNLEAGDDHTITLALKMQETAGNEYQNKAIGSDFSIQLLATQLTAETDSFDNQYDAFADYDGEISNAVSLAAALKNGGTYKVVSNIAVDAPVEIPAGVTVALDMNGMTIESANTYVFENQGNLTISGNGTFAGPGIIRSKAGSLTIESGNFYASSRWQDNTYQHTLKAENTNVVINGGNFDATINGQSNAVLNASTGSTVTINGGNFKNVSGDLTQFDPYLFTYEKDGKVIINDGTFYGGWRFNGETASTDIYGGTFTVGFDGQSFNASSTHAVTVYGGTFASQTYAKLTGKLSDIVADGYTAIADADGTYTVIKGVAVSDNEGLTDAISDGGTIVLSTGSYTMPVGSSVNLRGKSITITGTKDTIIDMRSVDARDQFVTGANIVFDGVTLNFGTSNYMGLANTASLTYKNCQINGLQFLYCADVSFENCDFNSNGAEHSVWTYGAQRVSFTGCDFTYGDRGINCYSDNDVTGGKQTVNFTDCTFTTTNAASKGAVEINSCYFSVGIEVNMDGCTAPAYGEMAYVSEWDSTNGANTTINIK